MLIDKSDADSSHVLMVIMLRGRQVTVTGTPMSEDLRTKASTVRRFLGIGADGPLPLSGQ